MRFLAKRWRLLALVAVFAVVAASCSSDTAETTTTAAPADTTTTAAPDAETTTTVAGAPAAMTITYTIDPAAVWSDGTPITVADFQCLKDATLNTVGSLSTSGYDQITSIEAGVDDHEVVVSFSTVYAPYKLLFNPIFPAHMVADCNDISADFGTSYGISGREWLLEEWSETQAILVPNTAYWNADKAPIAQRVVIVPKEDQDTEINSLLSGESGFIFPQAFSGITDVLDDPNIEYTPGYGTNYEGLYMMSDPGCGPKDDAECVAPFADPIFRKAFAMSVDRELILANIYDPIFPGGPLLQCGTWVPTVGPWCKNDIWNDSYDPEGAATLLTDNGWAQGADGYWAKDGAEATPIRWIINTGNIRRENTQALMIPVLQGLGFNVVADNTDADTYFQIRLPSLDYDLAMYISTASPDPTVTAIFACDQIPSPDNDNKGQNSTGWCNEDATALMYESDTEVDETARADLIHQIAQYMYDDGIMLPLYQFPNIGAWRTDQISGPVDANVANYRGFGNNLYAWEPVTGDQIIIGAEQWPGCINPITECANSSWMVWTTSFLIWPGAFDATAEGTFEVSDLLAGDPVVAVAEG